MNFKALLLLMIGFFSLFMIETGWASQPPIFMGYWEDWGTYDGFPMINNAGGQANPTLSGQLTEINALAFAFLEIAEDGTIKFADTFSDLNDKNPLDKRFCQASPESCKDFPVNAGLGNFAAFVQTPLTYHIVSVGGAGHDKDWQYAFNNPDRFVASLKLLVDTYNIHWIDIDYEPVQGVPQNYVQKFITLTTKIKQTLPDLTLSFTVLANPHWINNFGMTNWAQLKQNLNYISVMGYEMHGAFDTQNPYTALQSALIMDDPDSYSDESAILALNQVGIPNSMIILGIPLEGCAVGGVEKEGLGEKFTQSIKGDIDAGDCSIDLDAKNPCDGTIKYKTLVDDRYKAVSVIQNGVVAGIYSYDRAKKMFVSYDNGESAAVKTAYVKSHNLAGVMVWALRFDKPINDPNSIIHAISSELNR